MRPIHKPATVPVLIYAKTTSKNLQIQFTARSDVIYTRYQNRIHFATNCK